MQKSVKTITHSGHNIIKGHKDLSLEWLGLYSSFAVSWWPCRLLWRLAPFGILVNI